MTECMKIRYDALTDSGDLRELFLLSDGGLTFSDFPASTGGTTLADDHDPMAVPKSQTPRAVLGEVPVRASNALFYFILSSCTKRSSPNGQPTRTRVVHAHTRETQTRRENTVI